MIEMKYFVFVLLTALLLVAGCNEPVEQPQGKGTLILSITNDSIEGLDKIFVTFSSFEVHKTFPEEEWLDFSSQEKEFDLIVLQSDEAIKGFIGEKEINSGNFDKIRFELKEFMVRINGSDYYLELPSEKIEVKRDFEVSTDLTTEMIINFSSKSVVLSNGEYKLVPRVSLLTEKEFKQKYS